MPPAPRFTVPWRVADADGLHQVYQWVGNPTDGELAPEVKACRMLSGQTEAEVSFEYDGVIPSLLNSSFSYPTTHALPSYAVDTQGHRSSGRLAIARASPHHVATLTVQASYISDIAFSPDGRTLAAAGYVSIDETEDRGYPFYVDEGRISLWDVARREEVAAFKTGRLPVDSVAFSSDGAVVAAGSGDGIVRVWDAGAQREMATLEGHSSGIIESVAFSPDGAILASASWDSTVKLWDVAAQREVATLEGHTGIVSSVAFSPDGSIVASASWDSTVRVWDVAAQREVATLEGHTDGVRSVAFSPDGGILASGSRDGSIRLWDTAAWEEIAVLKGNKRSVRSIAYSPDGGTLAAGSRLGLVDLWDVHSEDIVEQYNHPFPVWSIAYSPDGRIMAAAGVGIRGRIELWDTSPYAIPDSRPGLGRRRGGGFRRLREVRGEVWSPSGRGGL